MNTFMEPMLAQLSSRDPALVEVAELLLTRLMRTFEPVVTAGKPFRMGLIVNALADAFDAGRKAGTAATPGLLAALQTMRDMWHAYIVPDNYDGHAAAAYRAANEAIEKATA